MKKHFVSLVTIVLSFFRICGVSVCAEGESKGSVVSSLTDGNVPVWVYICIGGFAVLVVMLLIVCLNLKKKVRISGVCRSDGLTGLKNKKYVKQCYEKSVSEYGTYNCLVYISKNYRSSVDRFGARQCETLLKEEAAIIKNFCQDYDYASIVERGEFVLSLRCRDGLHAEQRVSELVKKLNHQQYQTLTEIYAPYTAGICLPESAPLSFDSALTKAKLAYGYALDNCIPFYTCTADLVRNEVSRNKLRDHLSHAIDDGQFDMFLQFIYDVEKKEFNSAEALSRWNNPEEGFLMPGAYISDMQTTGVMEKFDYYMLDKVCAKLAEWNGTEFGNITLSCNITRITISSGEFMKHFNSVLSKYKFDRKKLILELTEDALIENQIMARKNIIECKNSGCEVAIDDFGSGNTSIIDLSDYPVDIIKVDRHVITKTTGTDRGNVVLRGIVELAHQLDMVVVCEGVETKRQSDIVIKNKCDFIQGYFYSYVMPLEEAKNFYLSALNKNGTVKAE